LKTDVQLVSIGFIGWIVRRALGAFLKLPPLVAPAICLYPQEIINKSLTASIGRQFPSTQPAAQRKKNRKSAGDLSPCP